MEDYAQSQKTGRHVNVPVEPCAHCPMTKFVTGTQADYSKLAETKYKTCLSGDVHMLPTLAAQAGRVDTTLPLHL